MSKNISIVIPCKNEQNSIGAVLDELLIGYPSAEIVVVNDGSTDKTAEILSRYKDITVLTHPYGKGNGATIKTGAKAATGEILVFMDADGQHNIIEITNLLENINDGYDMVVGSRDRKSQSSSARLVGNKVYNHLASLITGHKIHDLTSGFRACKRDKFIEFLSLLPNGFSYPTTITMAFFRSGYSVKYIPISVNKRKGHSHLSLLKDGVRFLLIIFKIGTLYSPLKILAPVSALFFSSGLVYYLYTYLSSARFTNMGLLLFTFSLLILIFGLISEQITMLLYMKIYRNNEHRLN